jgi:hypothetical protein
MKERFRLSRAQRPIIFLGNENFNIPSSFAQKPELQSHIEIKNREIFDVSDLVLPEIATFAGENKSKRQRQTKQFDFKKSKRKRKESRKSRKINR